jgi:hypothetical protein
VGLLLVPWVRRKRRGLDRTISRRANEAVYLEIQPPAGGEGETGGATELREASTTTGHAEEARWRKTGGESAAENAQVRVMPQLKSLMRDQVVSWLARQRGALLESHERGTQQVFELQQQLERIKQQFQERMITQQQRISELDLALRSKEKIILDLLRNRPPEGHG